MQLVIFFILAFYKAICPGTRFKYYWYTCEIIMLFNILYYYIICIFWPNSEIYGIIWSPEMNNEPFKMRWERWNIRSWNRDLRTQFSRTGQIIFVFWYVELCEVVKCTNFSEILSPSSGPIALMMQVFSSLHTKHFGFGYHPSSGGVQYFINIRYPKSTICW